MKKIILWLILFTAISHAQINPEWSFEEKKFVHWGQVTDTLKQIGADNAGYYLTADSNGFVKGKSVAETDLAILRSLESGITNVGEEGAVGDGIVDDTQSIQNAVNQKGKIIFGKDKTYLITSTIVCGDNTTLEGLTNAKIVSTITSGAVFEFKGTEETPINVTSNIGIFDETITVADASSLSADDLILVFNDEYWGTNKAVPTPALDSKKGLLKTIKSISGNILTLKTRMEIPFTDNSIKIRKLNTVKNIKIENLIAEGVPSTSILNEFARIERAENIEVSKLTTTHYNYASVSIKHSKNIKIKDCDFRESNAVGYSYGIVLIGAIDNVTVESCYAENLRHLFTCGWDSEVFGIAKNIKIRFNSAIQMRDAVINTHANALDVLIESNSFYGGFMGINLRTNNYVIKNNFIYGMTNGAIVNSALEDWKFRGEIINNEIISCCAVSSYSIYQDWNNPMFAIDSVKYFRVEGNIVTNNLGVFAIAIGSYNSGKKPKNVIIKNNIITNTKEEGMRLYDVDAPIITNNIFIKSNASKPAMYLFNTDDAILQSNVVKDFYYGFRLTNSKNILTGLNNFQTNADHYKDANSSIIGLKLNNLKSGATEPADLEAGELWIDTADRTLKIK